MLRVPGLVADVDEQRERRRLQNRESQRRWRQRNKARQLKVDSQMERKKVHNTTPKVVPSSRKPDTNKSIRTKPKPKLLVPSSQKQVTSRNPVQRDEWWIESLQLFDSDNVSGTPDSRWACDEWQPQNCIYNDDPIAQLDLCQSINYQQPQSRLAGSGYLQTVPASKLSYLESGTNDNVIIQNASYHPQNRPEISFNWKTSRSSGSGVCDASERAILPGQESEWHTRLQGVTSVHCEQELMSVGTYRPFQNAKYLLDHYESHPYSEALDYSRLGIV